jgi:hypothetical protein
MISIYLESIKEEQHYVFDDHTDIQVNMNLPVRVFTYMPSDSEYREVHAYMNKDKNTIFVSPELYRFIGILHQ